MDPRYVILGFAALLVVVAVVYLISQIAGARRVQRRREADVRADAAVASAVIADSPIELGEWAPPSKTDADGPRVGADFEDIPPGTVHGQGPARSTIDVVDVEPGATLLSIEELIRQHNEVPVPEPAPAQGTSLDALLLEAEEDPSVLGAAMAGHPGTASPVPDVPAAAAVVPDIATSPYREPHSQAPATTGAVGAASTPEAAQDDRTAAAPPASGLLGPDTSEAAVVTPPLGPPTVAPEAPALASPPAPSVAADETAPAVLPDAPVPAERPSMPSMEPERPAPWFAQPLPVQPVRVPVPSPAPSAPRPPVPAPAPPVPPAPVEAPVPPVSVVPVAEPAFLAPQVPVVESAPVPDLDDLLGSLEPIPAPVPAPPPAPMVPDPDALGLLEALLSEPPAAPGVAEPAYGAAVDAPAPAPGTPAEQSPPRPTARDVSEAPAYRMVAPIELWFADGPPRVGIRPGTPTYLKYQRLAQVLLTDLKKTRDAE